MFSKNSSTNYTPQAVHPRTPPTKSELFCSTPKEVLEQNKSLSFIHCPWPMHVTCRLIRMWQSFGYSPLRFYYMDNHTIYGNSTPVELFPPPPILHFCGRCNWVSPRHSDYLATATTIPSTRRGSIDGDNYQIIGSGNCSERAACRDLPFVCNCVQLSHASWCWPGEINCTCHRQCSE